MLVYSIVETFPEGSGAPEECTHETVVIRRSKLWVVLVAPSHEDDTSKNLPSIVFASLSSSLPNPPPHYQTLHRQHHKNSVPLHTISSYPCRTACLFGC